MRGEKDHPFVPGTEVLVNENYSSYNPGTFRTDVVLKTHKTGRFTLKGSPDQQWYAGQSYWDDSKTWYGYKTGRAGYSIYSTRLRLLDEDGRAELADANAKRDHKKRCEKIAQTFSKPDAVSFDLSAKVAAVIS